MEDKKTDKTRVKYDSLTVEGVKYKTLLTKKYKERKPYKEKNFRLVDAFISGTISDVFVKEGKAVKSGEPLLILEAMKMKNVIQSHQDGVIKNISVKTGDRVIKGQLLIELE